MCQEIVQFCSGSTKPLLFAGSCLTTVLAIAIGYLACTSFALYSAIDPVVAETSSLAYYLQLLAAAYLVLLTIFACFAAYYDQKYLIRALSIITSLNFIIALVAIFLAANNANVAISFAERLEEARKIYDFTDKPPKVAETSGQDPSAGLAMNSTEVRARTARMILDDDLARHTARETTPTTDKVFREALNSTSATKIWDNLQSRGCCGFRNATEEWKSSIPKSCCAKPEEAAGKITCPAIDDDHKGSCLNLIDSTGLHLLLLLAFIAIVNLYMATVSGISTYRTFHYNEASQNAYS